MVKIGILSMQRINNAGSLLQCYSLKRILESLGCDVFFIDIERNETDDVLMENHRKTFESENEGNGLFAKIKKIDKYAINRLKIKQISKRQDDIFNDFRDKYLEINKSLPSKEYDLCIIGSDEVFNCTAPSPWGFTSQLFGNIPNAKRIITYAACCGSTIYDDLPNTVLDRIKKSFEKIEGFSVRDANTRQFCEHITKKKVLDHLDPVLVGSFYEEIENELLPFNSDIPYCIVYSYYNRIYQEEDISSIIRFCESKKLRLVAVGAPQKWIKDYYALNPFQILKAFELSSFVITDTFHGTIFSYKYSNRFATLIRNSNNNKLNDLMHKLNIQQHCIHSYADLDSAFSIINDIAGHDSFVKNEREKTRTYLLENLEI